MESILHHEGSGGAQSSSHFAHLPGSDGWLPQPGGHLWGKHQNHMTASRQKGLTKQEIEGRVALQEERSKGMTQAEPAALSVTDGEDVEGLGQPDDDSWGDYPLDEFLIRHEPRTIYEVIRRINQAIYILEPDFQRDFIWEEDKQSKLIESVIMRIPLPVFYLAEGKKEKVIVVDGLQRLSTFKRFLGDEFKLKLPHRGSLNGKRFSDLSVKLQNRIEDSSLTFYIIDSQIPERAQLDIFERVNDGVPLTRQQMRNCLHMGKGTKFLKEEAKTKIFLKTTGGSLSEKTMRDREFVNRFCAFQLLNCDKYRVGMDQFLADCLKKMNNMTQSELSQLSIELRRSLENNFMLFNKHAFRKHKPNQERRSTINASLWDVMSTGLSHYTKDHVHGHVEPLRQALYRLLSDPDFDGAITLGSSNPNKVRLRFQKAHQAIEEVLGAHTA